MIQPDAAAETVLAAPAPASAPPTWGRLLKVLGIGGTLVSFPWVPLAWVLRLWVLGWLLELTARAASSGGSPPYPSWRNPWLHFKRGLSFSWELFLVLLPASFLIYAGWLTGWVISFERVLDYISFGPLTVIAGMLLLAWCFTLLPMCTVLAARSPGVRASWGLARARELTLLAPLRYSALLFVILLVHFFHQIARQPVLPGAPSFLLFGVLSFGAAMRLKLMWGRHYHRVATGGSDAPPATGWTRRLALTAMCLIGFFYAFGILGWQFLMWNHHSEWFAHSLFLIPGAPAPLGQTSIHW